MRLGFAWRTWLFYLALALPAILLPYEDYGAANRVRYSLGWPLSGMDVLVGNCLGDGWFIHFQPDPILLLLAALGSVIAKLAWKARMWASVRPDWFGAFVHATLTSLYCALVLLFLDGVIQVIWEWRLIQMQLPAIERALIFGRRWLPSLYALGAAAIFVALFLDSRLRPGLQRLFYAAFALGFVLAFYRLPYSVPRVSYRHLIWELDNLDRLIQWAHQEQIEPASERPKNDARQLDALETIFASTPQFGIEFWRASQRVADARGPFIIHAVMERSRTWTGEEGLIFVPLVALLPRENTLKTLKRYQESKRESDRLWAGEFLIELDAEDTNAGVQTYSKHQP